MKIIVQIILNGVGLYLCSQLMPNTIAIKNIQVIAIYASILYAFNLLLKPIIKIINIPFKIMTFGVSSIIIQACIILFCVSISNVLIQSNAINITNDFISYIKIGIVIGIYDYFKNLIL